LAEVAETSTAPALTNMLQGILFALLAALVYGFLGISFEVAGKRRYSVWDVILYKQAFGLLIGLGVWALGDIPFYDPRLVWLGLIGALSYIVGLAAYLTASRERDIAANWTIVNLSVVIPILVSVVWFHDVFTLAKGVGVLFTLLSIVFIGGSFQDVEGGASRWLRAISIAFFFNCWLMILFRFVPAGSEALFTVYFHGLSIPILVGYKLLKEPQWLVPRGLVAISLLAAVTHWGGIMLTMLALVRVARVSAQAGVIVYPITNGLVIPVGVLLGLLLLKQKIGRRSAIGVGFGMAGLVFFFLP
jgi:drug/metabolite transporter (DMT)-like permease